MTYDVCDHGRPDHMVLIGQLAGALGRDLVASPDSPSTVWNRLLVEVERLRAESGVYR